MMASLDLLEMWGPQSGEPLENAGVRPTPDTRNIHPVWDFNATNDTYLNFTGRLPPWYTPLTNIIAKVWAAFSTDVTTTHSAYLNCYLYRLTVDSIDSPNINLALFDAGILLVPSTSGRLGTATITMTPVTTNTFQPGDVVRLQFSRMGANVIDDATGDMELRFVALYEA